MSFYNNFRLFKKGIENWFSVALNMIILKKDVNCNIRNVGTVKINRGENYLTSSLFRAVVSSCSKELTNKQIEILKTYLNQFNKKIITITNLEDGKKFNFLNKEIFTIFESFFYGEYDYVPYSDEEKTLIDIGANIGDTALYFANKGYIVYAFEPLPDICDIAEQNINLNQDYKDKIKLINKAVSCKKGTIIINYDETNSAIAGEFNKKGQEIEVESLTIEDIIETYKIKPYFLKIDCEGCEVNIIKNSNLRIFSEIIMEYHTNFTGVKEEILIEVLESQGFSLCYKNEKDNGIGIIHMKK